MRDHLKKPRPHKRGRLCISITTANPELAACAARAAGHARPSSRALAARRAARGRRAAPRSARAPPYTTHEPTARCTTQAHALPRRVPPGAGAPPRGRAVGAAGLDGTLLLGCILFLPGLGRARAVCRAGPPNPPTPVGVAQLAQESGYARPGRRRRRGAPAPAPAAGPGP
ncbi:MAG: hypothetical protein J3K34DRAFT_406840 [Monoraphidium minutum]|nr:MAG: hypothetical protein J3K34DRAFT_406840 [Monoraphidium minutum]